jgi:hypothetical protein
MVAHVAQHNLKNNLKNIIYNIQIINIIILVPLIPFCGSTPGATYSTSVFFMFYFYVEPWHRRRNQLNSLLFYLNIYLCLWFHKFHHFHENRQ